LGGVGKLLGVGWAVELADGVGLGVVTGEVVDGAAVGLAALEVAGADVAPTVDGDVDVDVDVDEAAGVVGLVLGDGEGDLVAVRMAPPVAAATTCDGPFGCPPSGNMAAAVTMPTPITSTTAQMTIPARKLVSSSRLLIAARSRPEPLRCA
jgi:hypothetical protein